MGSAPAPGEEPILVELAAVGFEVGSLADLRRSGVRYREAIPELRRIPTWHSSIRPAARIATGPTTTASCRSCWSKLPSGSLKKRGRRR